MGFKNRKGFVLDKQKILHDQNRKEKKSVVQSNKTSRRWIINETHKHNFSKWKLYGLYSFIACTLILAFCSMVFICNISLSKETRAESRTT